MVEHRGEFLRLKIEESGVKKSKIFKLLNISSRTLYNYFKRPNLDVEIMVQIGRIIQYDFSRDMELAPTPAVNVDTIALQQELIEALKENQRLSGLLIQSKEENRQLSEQLASQNTNQ